MKLPVISTERLILRPWRMQDADDLFSYAHLPEVALPAGWNPHRSAAESTRTIRELYRGKCLALTLRGDDRPFGNIGLHNTSLCKSLHAVEVRELGFSMSPARWGRGYMTEAAQGVIDCAFSLLGLDCILLAHFEDNARTERIAAALGFSYIFTRGNEKFYSLFR